MRETQPWLALSKFMVSQFFYRSFATDDELFIDCIGSSTPDHLYLRVKIWLLWELTTIIMKSQSSCPLCLATIPSNPRDFADVHSLKEALPLPFPKALVPTAQEPWHCLVKVDENNWNAKEINMEMITFSGVGLNLRVCMYVCKYMCVCACFRGWRLLSLLLMARLHGYGEC